MANEHPEKPEGNTIEGAGPATQPEAAVTSSSTAGRGAFDARIKRTGNGHDKKFYLIAALIGIGGVLLIAGIVAVAISQMEFSSTQADEKTVKADPTLQVDQAGDDAMAKAKQAKLDQERRDREETERQAAMEKAKADKGNTSGTGGGGTSTSANQGEGNSAPPPPTPHQLAMQRKLMPGVNLTNVQQWSNGSQDAQGAGDPPPERMPKALPDMDSAPPAGSSTRGSLAELGGTGFAPMRAKRGPGRKYLLAHSTYARCALYTEVVTDHPGLVDCRLTEPLYSADGSTVLADAGDKLTGEQKIELRPGQAQVFTSWTELETQAGIRVRMDSLGAGPMGASGTKGWIDNHYPERFGGAVVLSFVQDALQAVANTTQRSSGSGGYTINNSEQNVENMASRALENSINIPPTGHLSPGTVLTVIVARDLDFSDVYENRR